MDYEALVNSLTPEIVTNMKRAIELGRWPDGKLLSQEQRGHCLRAVILWEQNKLSEPERTGYIDRGRKQGQQQNDTETRPLRWDES